jgi:hypothetical protein
MLTVLGGVAEYAERYVERAKRNIKDARAKLERLDKE